MDEGTSGTFDRIDEYLEGYFDGHPDGSLFIKAVLTYGASPRLIRLIARRLLDWDDDDEFNQLVTNIRD